MHPMRADLPDMYASDIGGTCIIEISPALSSYQLHSLHVSYIFLPIGSTGAL